MKAYKLNGINDLNYIDCKVPSLLDGWALVEVKASGICSSDIPRIFEKGTYNFPTTPGHEFSGVVIKVANCTDEYWLNKRVGVFPLIPCKNCSQCNQKHHEMCENYNYLGSRCDGGFAEYVAVPVWNLIELPENISFEEGAMLEPLAVALHAIYQAGQKIGDSVAIVGSGMIAFAIAQWARVFGAKTVCIIGRSDKKKELASQLNIDYTTAAQLDNKFFDIVIEAVGSNESIDTAISFVEPGGKIVLLGNPIGNIMISQKTYWRILRKQLCLIGSWNSAYDGCNDSEWKSVCKALANKTIRCDLLITHKYYQDKLFDGLDLMKNNTEPYCKIMVLWYDYKS